MFVDRKRFHTNDIIKLTLNMNETPKKKSQIKLSRLIKLSLNNIISHKTYIFFYIENKSENINNKQDEKIKVR